MRYLVLALALSLAACDAAQPNDILQQQELSFDDLKKLPTDCQRKGIVQRKIELILKQKNFDPNPDNLNLEAREYQSKLKSTYWWYEYSCGEQK
jgi:hypothetical protein